MQVRMGELEVRRYGRTSLPREERKCRLCETEIESPEHVLLECPSNEELVVLRREYVRDLASQCAPTTLFKLTHATNSVERLKTLSREPDSVRRTAQYISDTLAMIEQYPLYTP